MIPLIAKGQMPKKKVKTQPVAPKPKASPASQTQWDCMWHTYPTGFTGTLYPAKSPFYCQFKGFAWHTWYEGNTLVMEPDFDCDHI